MLYVVLGMHKSGTSLVSEMLHHAGISMGEGDDVFPGRGYDQGNKYERGEVFGINNDILDSHAVESIKISAPERLKPGTEALGRMEAMVRSVSSRHVDWGFKDPRVCLTYPLWVSVLPEHRIVAVYRSLYDLTTRYKADQSIARAYRMIASWHEHNLRILSYLRSTSMPWILLNYGRLMEGEAELHRLERFLGRPVCDRRRQDLRRGTPTRGVRMRLAESFYAMRTGRRAEDTIAQLEAAAREHPWESSHTP